MSRIAPHHLLALLLTCACVCVAPAALAKGSFGKKPAGPPGPLDVSLNPAAAKQKLEQFRVQVRALAAQGKKPVVVFDVDDTLVRIFGGKAVPGAAPFVNGVLEDGARIVYQCGRKESQRAQTSALLTNNGMPVNNKAQLWLKAQQEKASTVDWKKGQKSQIEALGCAIGFFDNEKVNSRMFRAAFPKSQVFRLNTSAYYPDPGGAGSIVVIDSFDPAAKPKQPK